VVTGPGWTDSADVELISDAVFCRCVSAFNRRSRSSIDIGEGSKALAGNLLDMFCSRKAAAAAALDAGLLPLGGRTLCGAGLRRGGRGSMLLGIAVTFEV